MVAGGGTTGEDELGAGEPRSFGNNRYVVQRRLGAGNFATVYLAFDERLDVLVAVKLLSDRWSWEPEVRGRFVQEARILRSLNDRHVVQIRDIAETGDGRPYLVMDFATEGTLEQRLTALAHAESSVSTAELREFTTELAAALGFLHARRIAHRDIKPSNILITRDDVSAAGSTSRQPDGLLRPGERLMLGDLGLAKDLRLDSGITVGVGTAGYMSPEQSEAGGKIDTRTDIYAASALVALVASGEAPDPLRRYSDGTLASGRPLPASISGAFRAALEHGLDQDPARRPQTIEAWRDDVDAGLATLEGRSSATAGGTAVATSGSSPRKLRLVAGLGAAALAVVVFGVIATSGDDEGDVATSTTGQPAANSTNPSVSSSVSSFVGSSTPTTVVRVTTVATTPPTTVPAPFVDITGPTTIQVGVQARWDVGWSGVVSGTWSLTGPVTLTPESSGWLPTNWFQGTWNTAGGPYTLTLTAVDAVGTTYVDSIEFSVI